jgi:hypothetical protein
VTNGSGRSALEGNGVGLVRERALAMTVQKALERLYQIEDAPHVDAFLRAAEHGEREALLVREAEDGTLEVSLRVPMLARRAFAIDDGADLDPLCQLIEGVSHFVYLAERAKSDREATQLEMEMQAEVDKYVVLAASLDELSVQRSGLLRERLYERVVFNHVEGSELGDRYRIANDTAAKFVRRLEREFVESRRFPELRTELRRFFRMGQEEKLRVVRAA